MRLVQRVNTPTLVPLRSVQAALKAEHNLKLAKLIATTVLVVHTLPILGPVPVENATLATPQTSLWPPSALSAPVVIMPPVLGCISVTLLTLDTT